LARGNNDREQGTERGKIRFIIAEVEGNNQTLQDLVRTMAPMLSRPVEVKVAPKLVQNGSAGTSPNAWPAAPDLFTQEAAAPEVEDTEDVEQTDGGPNTARRRRGDGPKKDRNAGIELVPDLDLVQEGGTSLKDFFSQKKPSTAEEQALVFAYYIKHHVKVNPIGPGHILMCFTHLEERKPLDLKQTIRNLSKSKGWLTCADMNDLKLTTAGENHVKHELGKRDAADRNGDQ
jgi:hypothetical protein